MRHYFPLTGDDLIVAKWTIVVLMRWLLFQFSLFVVKKDKR
jgi:hypothetical protein